MRLLFSATLFIVLGAVEASGQSYSISTFAGGALPINIQGPAASLYGPNTVTVDKAGNVLFVDQNDVLRFDAQGGGLTLVAGTGVAGFYGDNGPAINAQLKNPSGLALDYAGNLYIADSGNHRIRRVSNGLITTVAGTGTPGFSGDNGPATSAQLNGPATVATDTGGNIYISDTYNNRVRRIIGGTIVTVAGNGANGFSGDGGPATSAELFFPGGIAVDSDATIYIADDGNDRVREVIEGVITTVAGGGTSTAENIRAISATLSVYGGVATDGSGNLYVVDSYSRIRKVSNGLITTIAGGGINLGDGGPATSAALGIYAYGGIYPANGIAADSAGNIYVADYGSVRLARVANGTITSLAGNGRRANTGDNGPATAAEVNLLNSCGSSAFDSAGNVWFSDTANNRIRKVSAGVITTVAGNGTKGFSGDNGPAISAEFNQPCGIAIDSTGILYVADGGNSRVRKIAGGVISTFAGTGVSGFSGDNGPAANAQLIGPVSVAVDAAGNVFIADGDRVRKVSNGVITTFAGQQIAGYGGDGYNAVFALLSSPSGVAVDSEGNVYIADYLNQDIRKVTKGIISTVAGNPPVDPASQIAGFSGDDGPATNAELAYPRALAVDSGGNLFIADTGNNRVREVSKGVITTVAGGGIAFSDNGPASEGQLVFPAGIAVDPGGNVYVADTGNDRIHVLTPVPPPSINQGGIVPIYSSVPVIQAGSWISIYGSNLAGGTSVWNGDFPTSLGGVNVTVDNKPAYLWVVSPTQINLQVPDDATRGLVSVVVTTAFGTAASTVTLAAYGPSFSLLGDGKHAAGVIPTPDGSGAYGGGTYDLEGPAGAFSYSTRPVRAGETLVLYGVGFGPTTPAVPAGSPFSGAAIVNNAVTITIGGVNAVVAFAGITEAGLYQFNLTVPMGTGSGDQALLATVGGVQAPLGVVVTVQ